MEMISALKLNSFIRSNRAFCMESLWFFHITSCDLWINITLFLPSDVNDFYFFFLPNFSAAAAAAKSLQLDPTLCDLIDGSPPGSPVPEILKARTLEWVVISFSNAWKWKVKVKSLSCVQLFATAWTAAFQAPPSVGFCRQEYWSEMPSPSPA